MFTGIVRGLVPVLAIDDAANLRRLTLDLTGLTTGLEAGASVAVNGACLTVTRVDGDAVEFDVIAESLSHTNLGELTVGARVNVERSLAFGDEVGGHLLSGHVTDTATIAAVTLGDNERVVWLQVDPRWMRYLRYKGFVALDGASLTISAVDGDRCRFSVSLIPETIDRTTLGEARQGRRVNLEIDAQTQTIVDTVERVLAERVVDASRTETS